MKKIEGFLRYEHDYVVYEDGDSQITASEFDILTKRISVGLQNSSLDLNSTILYYLPSRLQFLFSWSLIRLGVRSGGYNLSAEKLNLGKITTLTSFGQFDRSKHEILLLSPKVLYEMTQLDEKSYQGDKLQDAELIVFSSGSSGEPKAIQFGFQQLFERSLASGEKVWTKKKPFMSLLGQSSTPGLHKKIWDMSTSQTYLPPSGPAQNLRLIQKHGVRAIQASPNQLGELLAHAKQTHETMPSLELVKIAGGFASKDLVQQIGENVEVWNTYASSEAGPITNKKNYAGEFGNVGSVVEGSKLEIVDKDNKQLPKGETGTIRVKRANMASSYLDSSNEAFFDGWFYPGDRGFLNPADELVLVGRNTETENVGGLKLSINNVDQSLSDIPLVKEIAGFFYEDSNGMKKLGVAFVPAKGFDLPNLMLEMRWRLGEKTPKLVMQVEKLPRSNEGKLLREKLSELGNGRD